MVRTATQPSDREGGFTLIELLVVILVIGILAAIALPAFLGQQVKAQDALAKSDARNLVSEIESCAADSGVYTDCDTLAELAADGPIGLAYGPGAGEVEVLNPTPTGYDAVAHSRSGTDFRVERRDSPSPPYTRVCDQPGQGGCPASGFW